MKINKIKLIYSYIEYIDNPYADDYLYFKSEYESAKEIYNFYKDFEVYCKNGDDGDKFMLPGFIYNFVNLHNTGKFKF